MAPGFGCALASNEAWARAADDVFVVIMVDYMKASGGVGDGWALASVIGGNPAINQSRSAPSSSRAGNGSAAKRLIRRSTNLPK